MFASPGNDTARITANTADGTDISSGPEKGGTEHVSPTVTTTSSRCIL